MNATLDKWIQSKINNPRSLSKIADEVGHFPFFVEFKARHRHEYHQYKVLLYNDTGFYAIRLLNTEYVYLEDIKSWRLIK